MLILNEAETRAALPMAAAIQAVREVMVEQAEGRTHQPLRTAVHPPGLPGSALLKPAALMGAEPAFGLKVISLFHGNPERGLPAINGFVAMLDPDTGMPMAIIDGGVVTEIRTGAASAVATDLLAREDAGNLALLGAGVQASAHLAAMATVRELRRVRVWNRTLGRATELVTWAARQGWTVEPCDTAQAAVVGADLVCTVTTSPDPVLEGAWLADGVHINAVGAFQPTTRELAGSVLARADLVVVDATESAATEAGDLLLAIQDGAIPSDATFPELGAVLTGRSAGRTSDGEVTVFKSLGLAIQDLAAARVVLQRAGELGLGTEIPWGPAA